MSQFQELDHLKIPLEDIKSATNNFSDDNFLGRGGFGMVYKGQLHLPTTTRSGDPPATIAVKRLNSTGDQGEKEFLIEIAMLSSYKHANLVSLIGFTDEDGEKIIVYKHEARGSLDKHLASRNLTWVQRLQICLGAARGLNYLHSGVGVGHRVLHRDVKSSNVLLDEDWEAKISDFGLSKIGPTNQEITCLVTGACGTFGYVDPVYVSTGILTKESDVYSFGVVLFEVLCGRLATKGKQHDEQRSLCQVVKLLYKQEKLDEIIIPNLRKQMKPNSLRTFSRIAYQCLKSDRKKRPTMGLIIEELQIALELQIDCRRITKIGLWGSNTGGSPWSFPLESNKLRKIRIEHKDWIYSIGFTIDDLNGSSHSSERNGGAGPTGGEISEINFGDGEEMIEILGTVGVTTGRFAGYTVISSLCFVTNNGRKGPFGMETGTPFSVPWDVGSFAGFYGRAGYYLDGFGCYLKGTISYGSICA